MIECPVIEMRKRLQLGTIVSSAALCVALLLGAPIAALAADGSARAVEASGRVSVERNSALWAIFDNSFIQPGEIVVTGPDGYAVFQLEDGSKFQVFPNSKVVFRANRGNWRDLLDIALGKVKIQIQKLGGRPNPYRVNTATALIAVRGTTFEVDVQPDATTIVAVEEGLVGVSHLGQEVLLKTGEVLTVRPNEPLYPPSVGKARMQPASSVWR